MSLAAKVPFDDRYNQSAGIDDLSKPLMQASDDDRLSFVIRLPVHPLARPVTPEVPGEAAPKVTPEVTPEVGRIVVTLRDELSRTDLQQALGLKDEKHFRKAYLLPALDSGLLEMTRPETSRSSKQRYRLTALGQRWLDAHSDGSIAWKNARGNQP